MEMKPSDCLNLRVFAIRSRLREVSMEISRNRGEAFVLREEVERRTVASLIGGAPSGGETDGGTGIGSNAETDVMKARARERETAAERLEMEETRLKKVLFAARRDHLRQLRQEKPGRWLLLE